MSNRDNMCQPPDYPYELIREEIGDFIEQAKRRREIEEIVGDMPIDRLRELVEADRDGRCVVLPSVGYTDKDGENALKSAMNTCFYHNNPVTRYIADAVAEKLTKDSTNSALKGEQHEISES